MMKPPFTIKLMCLLRITLTRHISRKPNSCKKKPIMMKDRVREVLKILELRKPNPCKEKPTMAKDRAIEAPKIYELGKTQFT